MRDPPSALAVNMQGAPKGTEWRCVAQKLIREDQANGVHRTMGVSEASGYRVILNNVPEEAAVADIAKKCRVSRNRSSAGVFCALAIKM